MKGDAYVRSVVDYVPHGLPLRDQIAMELRGHIAERTASGQPIDQVLEQLGDPLTLAESYLAAVSLPSAGHLPRIAAKLIDVAAVLAPVVAALVSVRSGFLTIALLPETARRIVPLLIILGVVGGFPLYTAIAEHRYGRTLGKRLMGIQVVRESGTRISLGQSLLRQLPFVGQFYFIDALFMFFTTRRQRAFELLTKTRAVALLLCIVLLAGITLLASIGLLYAPWHADDLVLCFSSL